MLLPRLDSLITLLTASRRTLHAAPQAVMCLCPGHPCRLHCQDARAAVQATACQWPQGLGTVADETVSMHAQQCKLPCVSDLPEAQRSTLGYTTPGPVWQQWTLCSACRLPRGGPSTLSTSRTMTGRGGELPCTLPVLAGLAQCSGTVQLLQRGHACKAPQAGSPHREHPQLNC